MAERKLRTEYAKDMALLPTRVSKFWLAVLLAAAILYPFATTGGSFVPVLSGSPAFWLAIAITVLIAATGALGLNLLSGFAGQISLGHAFFLGVGAFVGAMVTAEPGTARLSGLEFFSFGLPWWVAVVAGGLAAAAIGVVIGPTAVRLRGLYLSLVTLALLFLGEWLFTSKALERVTGSVQGRGVKPVSLVIPGFDEPLFGLINSDSSLARAQQLYFAALLLAVLSYLIGKNISRSRVGRAFQATRDRDIAAEVIGVNVTWAKLVAFGISSFFAGTAGVLLGVFLGNPIGSSFGGAAGLLLSVEYVAMIVIGGIGTITGAALGAVFVVGLPEVTSYLVQQDLLDPALAVVAFVGALIALRGVIKKAWRVVLLGIFLVAVAVGTIVVGVAEVGQGSFDTAALNVVLFGVLIVGFLILEPHGLYGLWVRARNYWKGWPFSY